MFSYKSSFLKQTKTSIPSRTVSTLTTTQPFENTLSSSYLSSSSQSSLTSTHFSTTQTSFTTTDVITLSHALTTTHTTSDQNQLASNVKQTTTNLPSLNEAPKVLDYEEIFNLIWEWFLQKVHYLNLTFYYYFNILLHKTTFTKFKNTFLY